MKLTAKESTLYEAVKCGMDSPGTGWLHELTPGGWSNRTAAGVLSSLIRKGLVTSHMEPGEGNNQCYWIELTTNG